MSADNTIKTLNNMADYNQTSYSIGLPAKHGSEYKNSNAPVPAVPLQRRGAKHRRRRLQYPILKVRRILIERYNYLKGRLVSY
jgi:hypothetical protein